MNELFFNDEGVVTIALLHLRRRDVRASQMRAVGIIPIEKICRRRLQTIPNWVCQQD
jgi:hypothetical protein